MEDARIVSLVEDLRQLDNPQGYKLKHEKAKKKLSPVIGALVAIGEPCVDYLHPLLAQIETWSCMFALKILREINSARSVLPLIKFVKDDHPGDYWENYEAAMNALTGIGEPAVMPLLSEIKSSFERKKYPAYLVGAATAIKNEQVFSFMILTLRDYLGDPGKYDDWFVLEGFTYDFRVQGNKAAVPLLKQLVLMDHLSNHEKTEIQGSIDSLEDPKKFKTSSGLKKYELPNNLGEKEMLEIAVGLEAKKDYVGALECVAEILQRYPSSYHGLFLQTRIKRRMGEADFLTLDMAHSEARKQDASQEVLGLIEAEGLKLKALYREAETCADEEMELNFRCLDCMKRQNIKPGLIQDVGGKAFIFENEIMCRRCYGNNMELTRNGRMEIVAKMIGMVSGRSHGLASVSDKVYVENKKMDFDKIYGYLLNRQKEEPLNGEIFLRTGNAARKQNRYREALEHYKMAMELNPRLIATLLNLVEVFYHRHEYYGIKGARDEAVLYLGKMKDLCQSRDYDAVTIKYPGDVTQFIREMEADLGMSSNYTRLKTEEVRTSLEQSSTMDSGAVVRDIRKMAAEKKDEAKELLEQNKGVKVLESYHIIDKKTGKSQILNLTSIMGIDLSQLCICGSAKYLKDCCFQNIKKPFAKNTDYETYSPVQHLNRRICINKEYDKLVESLKEDPRFCCDEEKNSRASFLYYGNTFYSAQGLGTVIFGMMDIKIGLDGRAILEMKGLTDERFESLRQAVHEHADF